MCGIAGYASTRRLAGASEGLRRMATAIAHRGPDDHGFFETAAVTDNLAIGLAHRRLAIIDMTTGHQPLGNEDGSIQIVFNGEIYNFQDLRAELAAYGHRFATRSDTETIVHAYEQWGVDCVNHLRGMFAFAIWDGPRERLLLARDRFGKKPLFLFERDGMLLFASEIKALLAFPSVVATVDRTALWDYFAYRYVPAPATLFAGIRKLPPGSYGLWQAGRFVTTQYYALADRGPRRTGAPAPAPVAEFARLLEDSVRLRMIADVPFGAFLSGGLDSSTIVGLMCRHASQRVKTFSVGFGDSPVSELAYARTVAIAFDTEHHELTITHRDVIEQLPALVRFRDAPVAEPSDVPVYLLAREARRSVKMVLTGEGADEILGGYPKHVFERYAAAYQRLPSTLRRRFQALMTALPSRFRRANTAVAALALEHWAERMPRWFGAVSPSEQRALLRLQPPASKHAPLGAAMPLAGNSALRSILYFDQVSWLPDNLLERGDRMTMAASLEARMPFMDHTLAEFVTTLSDTWRVRRRTTKYILRAAAHALLPRAILQRPKIGFRVPVDEWFRGPLREFLLDHLLEPASRTREYYHPQVLKTYVDEHLSGRRNHEKLLWSLLTLELWHREFNVSLAV